MAKPVYYLTAPVYDAAAAASLGSLYSWILCDAVARHKGMLGFEAVQFAGVETHGVGVDGARKAAVEDRGAKPAGDGRAAAIKENYGALQELAELADIPWAQFARTSSPQLVRGVQALLRATMRYSGTALYKANYQGRYCALDGIDVSDSAAPAYCPVCGQPAELISEERVFFRLSAFRDRLIGLYKYRASFVQPRAFSEGVEELVGRGLKDISISRKAGTFGVTWPDDATRAVSRIYAELASYLGAVGYGSEGNAADEFRQSWSAKLHVIGKEALASHAICWPAFLMAADVKLPLHIFAHGTLTLEQPGGASDDAPRRLLQAIGGDALRYCLLREVAYGEDAKLSLDGLLARYNEDLAGGLGNFARRILALVARYSGGKIPRRSMPGILLHFDPTIELALLDTSATVRWAFDNRDFSDGLKRIWSLIATIDGILTAHIPSDVPVDRQEKSRVAYLLHDASEALSWIAMLLHPVLPQATSAIWECLGQSTSLDEQLIDHATPLASVMPGSPVTQLGELFPRVEKI
jgi:methionyl-tRNA synthetase